MKVAPRSRIKLLILAMVGVAGTLSLVIDGFYSFDSTELSALAAMAGLFMISEQLVFHVEARTEAVSYSPSDVALGIGIVFFGPLGLVVARLVGASIGQALFRRTDVLKWAFNLANFLLETLVAYALFRAAVSTTATGSLRSWLALTGALFLALLLGGFLVATAISCFEGGLITRLRNEVANAPVFHVPGATVAAAVATAMMVAPFLGIVVASLVPVIWLIVRSHGRLLHRYSDLIGAHEFSREVGDASELPQILAKAAEQIAANMRGKQVAIRIWDRAGGRAEAFFGGRALAAELPADLAALGRSDFVRRAAEYDGSGSAPDLDQLRVLLSDEQGVIGCVVVAERAGVNSAFEVDDLRRLTAMTQQLTVAVRKGQLHAQIRHQATHDRLTGLPNRGFFEAWVHDSLTAPGRNGCVLFVDMDRFKEVNDAFGHHAGDALLQQVAERLQYIAPIDGLASRFGGDEFALFAPNLDLTQAQELAARLAAALDEPFVLDQVSVAITPSVGIVESSMHGRITSTLLRRADIAMYEAKKRNIRVAVYTDELEENDAARLKMLVDLRTAIATDQLEVHFQPQIEMRTGAVIGAEALARWNHPDHGEVSPEVFIELAEAAGLIEALTDRVLARALEAAAQWQRRGWQLNIAVNVSARSLLDQQLVQMVETYLGSSGLEASRLTLEITESTMMADPARTHLMLHSLTALGVTISVDDFGTGYSSLRSLGHLPVSELKIDRSFVMAMTTSGHDAIIVRSTIDLAHNLGLRAVAEGVEDDAMLHRLAALDCDLAQGYGISRPLPLTGFNHWFVGRSTPQTTVDDLPPADVHIDPPARPRVVGHHVGESVG